MKRRPEAKDFFVGKHDVGGVRNSMELRVVEAMKKLLPKNKKYDDCQLCTEDIYALSLNRLTPRYEQVGTIVLQKGVSEEEVMDVVNLTIEQVVSRPNHD